MKMKFLKLFLRLAVSFGFLSAVLDRLGYLDTSISVWGNWSSFIEYTQLINPWFPESIIPAVGFIATLLEIVLPIMLIVGYKTEFAAKVSGILLLFFGIAMVFSLGIKSALDYSVFSAAGAAFAISIIKVKFIECDMVIK